MEESVLYRVILAKTFLEHGRRNATEQDVTSLAIAVVNVHDAFDNLLGAIATHVGTHLSENASLMKVFDRLASDHALHGRVQLDQLNTMRNGVKHQGLHPNADVVRRIVAEVTALADDLTVRFFQRPATSFRSVDLVRDDQLRSDMALALSVMDAGDYRNALEQLAFVMFRIYELPSLRDRRMGRAVAALRGEPPRGPAYDFPEIDKTAQRLDFVELGLDPREYELFHAVVPRVGLVAGSSETAYVMKKERLTWHEANWTRENCDRAFDLLLRLIGALQNRKSRPQIIYHQPFDTVRFVRNSALFKDSVGTVTLAVFHSGDEVAAVALPFVDGTWQNFGDRRVYGQFLELTRFGGHLRMLGGVHDGKAKEVFVGVAAGAGAAHSSRSNAGRSGERVRAVGAGDSELGQASRSR